MKFLKGLGYAAAGLWVFLFSYGATMDIMIALFPRANPRSFLSIVAGFIIWFLVGPGVIMLPILVDTKIKEHRKRKAKAVEEQAQEQARLIATARQQARSEGFTDGLMQGRKEGLAQGRKEGLAQGREEGYSLGHSEGYKYALYAQNRFRYYNGDPPLTYAEARRSLDEGTDSANGELIEPEPPAPPTRAPEKKRRSRKKKSEPGTELTTAAPEAPDDEELDRLFQEVKENYERNGFKLNTSDGCEYDAAGFDRNGLDRNGFTRDGLGSNGRLPYRGANNPATDTMNRLRREGPLRDPY